MTSHEINPLNKLRLLNVRWRARLEDPMACSRALRLPYLMKIQNILLPKKILVYLTFKFNLGPLFLLLNIANLLLESSWHLAHPLGVKRDKHQKQLSCSSFVRMWGTPTRTKSGNQVRLKQDRHPCEAAVCQTPYLAFYMTSSTPSFQVLYFKYRKITI